MHQTIELKGEIDKYTIIVRDFNTPTEHFIKEIDRISARVQKKEELNTTINQQN